MKQFSAEEKGFHGTIKAVVEINEAKGQINKVWAENVTQLVLQELRLG